MSVGVRTPLGGCELVGIGIGPGAPRAAPLCIRPLPPPGALAPATPPTNSDIGALASSQSVVKGNGLRKASSRVQRTAAAVVSETRVDRRGKSGSFSRWNESSMDDEWSPSVCDSDSAGRIGATLLEAGLGETGRTETGIDCSMY